MARTLLLVLALSATGASAEPARISLLPFKGPSAKASRAQLEAALCRTHRCIAPGSKGKKESVAAVVGGTVTKSRKKLTLQLQVFTGEDTPALRKSFALSSRGKMAPKVLASAVRSVNAAVRSAAEEEEPAAPSEPLSLNDLVAAVPTEEQSPSQEERRPVAPVVEEPPASTVALSERLARPWTPLFAIQVGSDFFARQLAYSGLEAGRLRSYQAPLLVAPRVRVELHPLRGSLLGASVEADYANAVGTRSRRGNDEVTFPTSASRLDLAARVHLRPMRGSKLVISAHGGYRMADFAVGAAADGSILEGLPGIAYRAVRAGAAVEVPLFGELSAFAEASYLHVLSSGELLGGAYFSGGSVAGLEALGGLRYPIASGFELRASGQLTRYSFRFTSEPGEGYVAQGAEDRYLGGALQLRYAL